MIEFERHSACTLCPLWQSANNPGLATRPLLDGQEITKDVAVLFVGQNPGYNEDKSTKNNPNGKSWIGFAGGLLFKFIEASGIPNYADVYLANACRCKNPQGGDITQSQIRVCREHLLVDIVKLQKEYKEVILVALGAKACYSVIKITSLNEALKKQGTRTPLFPAELPSDNPRVFFTYHPAILHPSRKPALIHAVEAHFNLLTRYLKREFIPNELVVIPEVGAQVPLWIGSKETCDIETYGILAGVEQTVFNPIKSKYIDGVDYDKQVVTVSFAYRDLTGLIRTPQYRWDVPRHRLIIRQWFRRLCKSKHVLTGQNIKYDLMYLWMADVELRYWINPNRLCVDDTLLWSFLLDEQQPEKGLKELSTLYGLVDYSNYKVMSKAGTAKSSADKHLHLLNSTDSAGTLLLAENCERLIKERFGSESPKLSHACSQMRNTVIWDTFDLDLNGSSLDVPRIQKFHDEEKAACKSLLGLAETDMGIKLAGKGSDAPLREFMLKCVQEAGLLTDSRVEWSDKTGKVSIGVENVNLVKKYLPQGEEYTILSMFQEFKERSKIVNTYTNPLLTKPRQGIVYVRGNIGMVFPSWYPIPSYFERGGSSDDKSGGQIQGRFSCKKPARQTEPHSIRQCSVSRWPGGKLVEWDVNQDHLRMAALLSGDPVLMDAYLNPSESIHSKTALTIFPGADPTDPGWKKSDMYKLGKTLNFLVLFKGGAAAFQRTALEDAQVEVEIGFCREAISKWYKKHFVYGEWQEQQIALASKQGFLVLPTGWSRTFGPAGTNTSSCEGDILNFLHQTPCAQITQSVHYEALRRFLKYHLHSLICLNIYDALFTDIYPGEEKTIREIMTELMTHPPLLPVFEKWVGRTVPWDFECREY